MANICEKEEYRQKSTESKISQSLLKIQQVEREWSQLKQGLKNAYPLNRTLDLSKPLQVREFKLS